MLTHHDDHRRDIRTLTTSRLLEATPRHLARALRHPSLFRPPATDPQRPPPVAVDLDPTPDGRGAVTLYGPHDGISERHPLQTRQASTGGLTAATGDDPAIHDATLRDAGETPALALTIDLAPLVQPGSTITTRVTLSFHFVHEPWWPHDLTDALSDLADLWLQRLAEQAYATAPGHQTSERGRTTRAGPSPFSHRYRPR